MLLLNWLLEILLGFVIGQRIHDKFQQQDGVFGLTVLQVLRGQKFPYIQMLWIKTMRLPELAYRAKSVI